MAQFLDAKASSDGVKAILSSKEVVRGAFFQLSPPVVLKSGVAGTLIIASVVAKGQEVFLTASGGLFVACPAAAVKENDFESMSKVRDGFINSLNVVLAALSLSFMITRQPVSVKGIEVGAKLGFHVAVVASVGNSWILSPGSHLCQSFLSNSLQLNMPFINFSVDIFLERVRELGELCTGDVALLSAAWSHAELGRAEEAVVSACVFCEQVVHHLWMDRVVNPAVGDQKTRLKGSDYTFSVRLELLLAKELITQDVYDHVNTLRTLRNVVAHGNRKPKDLTKVRDGWYKSCFEAISTVLTFLKITKVVFPQNPFLTFGGMFN